MSQAKILKDWITHGSASSICMLLMIAVMFGLMSLLARSKANPEEIANLKALERNTRVKAFLFFLLPLNWLPMLFGSQTPLAPVGLMILVYIALSNINGAKFRSRLSDTFKASS
ncbi:hypothetical protein OA162_03915 [Synechococcus sp. AH-736-A19]|nr:hypothetical protein [Synechococcus sp. AH-736-A19]